MTDSEIQDAGYGVYYGPLMLGWFPDELEAAKFKVDWLKVNQGVKPDDIIIVWGVRRPF